MICLKISGTIVEGYKWAGSNSEKRIENVNFMRKNIRKKVFLNFEEKSKYAQGYCISEAFPCGVFWWNADDLLIYCTLCMYEDIPHSSNILYMK
jgi:hypothetical protein